MHQAVIAWIKRHPIVSSLIGLVLLFILYRIITPSPPRYEYVTVKADRGEVERLVSASGKVRALNIIKVGSEVSGLITDVYVDFNTPVKAGQLLARIDDTRIRARVTQAMAQVDLARASLAQAEAAITRSRTDVEVQQREYERRQALVERAFVSKAQLDQAENALANARASLATAQAQAKTARAQIAQSTAELESAQLDLSRTQIVAPTSGIVINKLVEPGTTVAASFQTPNLFEIAADTSRMQVEASVDEADIGQVRVGQPVRFTVDSYPDDTFRATVQQIRKSATENQNVVSYLVILDVDNREGKLLTGMTANVEIVTGRKAKVLRVPGSAIRFRPRKEDRDGKDDDEEEKRPKPGTAEVWLATDDPYKPEPRTIGIGLQGEEHVEVVKGLKAGEAVLVRSKSLVPDDSEDEAP